jgi:predicted Mrr-cat superfamily restriction endonuclease
MLYRFANEMQIGNLVLTPDAEAMTVLVGRIASDYEYRNKPPIPDHQHVRRVEWLGRVRRDDLSRQARQAIGAPMAVFKPGAQEAVAQAVRRLMT